MRITLESNGYEVGINTLGAELKSYKDAAGKEFIWTSDPTYWSSSSPLLFPSIGNVRNGKTIIEDVEVSMPKHGFCSTSEFTVLSQSKNQVVLALTENENTKKCFPFDFEVKLTYLLQEASLYMTYEVNNHDTKEMYYHLGAHPGFLCPLEENEVFSDYQLVFEQEETCDSPVYDIPNRCFSTTHTKHLLDHSNTIPLRYDLFDDDAIVFNHMRSNNVKIINPATGKGVQVDYPDFATVAFWTPEHNTAPFICVEPWNGAAIYDDEDDIFKHKRDMQFLSAGDSKEYHLKIQIL
ncbi:MAG: aldose 1-epimerase family protein [Lachnospiraceae bacterium]